MDDAAHLSGVIVPEPGYILAAILVAGAVTWALRAVPFVMLAPLRNSALLAYLGERMPVGIMAILALYTLQGTNVTNIAEIVPTITALVVTVALHLWRGQMIVSIFGGTAVYVLLASLIAA